MSISRHLCLYCVVWFCFRFFRHFPMHVCVRFKTFSVAQGNQYKGCFRFSEHFAKQDGRHRPDTHNFANKCACVRSRRNNCCPKILDEAQDNLCKGCCLFSERFANQDGRHGYTTHTFTNKCPCACSSGNIFCLIRLKSSVDNLFKGCFRFPERFAKQNGCHNCNTHHFAN